MDAYGLHTDAMDTYEVDIDCLAHLCLGHLSTYGVNTYGGSCIW